MNDPGKNKNDAADTDADTDEDLLTSPPLFKNPVFWFALIGLPIILSLFISFMSAVRTPERGIQPPPVERAPEATNTPQNNESRDPVYRGPYEGRRGRGL